VLEREQRITPVVTRRPTGRLRRLSFRRPAERTAILLTSESLDLPCRVLGTFAIAWCASVLGEPKLVNKLQQRLLRDWIEAENRSYRHHHWVIAWAIMSTPLVGAWGVDSLGIEPVVLDAFFSRQMEDAGVGHERIRCGIYVCSYYLDLPWRREELVQVIKNDDLLLDEPGRIEVEFLRRILGALGEDDFLESIGERRYRRR
jgi:hypothetical protein